MRKVNKNIFLFSLFLLGILINSISALNLDYTTPNIKINSLRQLCSIEDKEDLHCKTIIDFYIINRTNQEISIYLTESLGSVYAEFNKKSIKLCNRESYGGAKDYRNFNISCNSSYNCLKISTDFSL